MGTDAGKVTILATYDVNVQLCVFFFFQAEDGIRDRDG